MKKQGFTLMEILIVIAMLGILATIIFGTYLNSLKKGRDSRRKQDLEQVSRALELYYSEQGQYPAEIEVIFGEKLDNPDSDDENIFYMKLLPTDPTSGYDYIYKTTDQQDYQLYSCLENDQDLDYNDGEFGYGFECGASCQYCRYGIASPNSVP